MLAWTTPGILWPCLGFVCSFSFLFSLRQGLTVQPRLASSLWLLSFGLLSASPVGMNHLARLALMFHQHAHTQPRHILLCLKLHLELMFCDTIYVQHLSSESPPMCQPAPGCPCYSSLSRNSAPLQFYVILPSVILRDDSK